ncbi:nucleotidyltransferase family protein [Candidatus Pacearchaeota archaeon]|nr:nucleotidyltransferase family protein [Candidatus Pacearchaeota archaeon]
MVYDRRGYAVYIWVEKLTEEIKEKTKFTRGERNLDEIKKKVTPILERYGVTKAGIFGSFARGENDPYSDVDILVEMPKEADYSAYLDLLMALEEVLGRKVDLVEYPLLRKEIREDVLREEVLVRL